MVEIKSCGIHTATRDEIVPHVSGTPSQYLWDPMFLVDCLVFTRRKVPARSWPSREERQLEALIKYSISRNFSGMELSRERACFTTRRISEPGGEVSAVRYDNG